MRKEQVNIRITKEEKKALQAIAKLERRSVSNVVVMAICKDLRSILKEAKEMPNKK